jgi:hypothetical protein
VPVTQYRVITVSRVSLLNRDSRSPPQSLHARYFSTSQAASPDGESASAAASVIRPGALDHGVAAVAAVPGLPGGKVALLSGRQGPRAVQYGMQVGVVGVDAQDAVAMAGAKESGDV